MHSCTHTIYKLYGNGLILYIIDRLWKAGLLCENQGTKSGVYNLTLCQVKMLSHAGEVGSPIKSTSTQLAITPVEKLGSI